MIDERILKNVPDIDKAEKVKQSHVSELTEQVFKRQHIDQNTPVLIKDGLKNWPAFKNWSTPGYLEDIGGDTEVSYYRHLNFSNDKNMRDSKEKTKVKFSEAIGELRSDIDEVLFMPVDMKSGPFKKLKEDMKGFSFLPKKPNPLYYPDSRMFLYKGAGSSWHLHVLDETIMCQFAGNKRVVLIRSDDDNYEELKDIFYNDRLMEQDDALDKLKGKLKLYVADVGAGDALYIPPNWWHGVQPTDHEQGITIPYCWRSPYHKISNLRYPAVRELFKDAFKKPGLPMLFASFYGVATMLAQCVHRCKLMVSR